MFSKQKCNFTRSCAFSQKVVFYVLQMLKNQNLTHPKAAKLAILMGARRGEARVSAPTSWKIKNKLVDYMVALLLLFLLMWGPLCYFSPYGGFFLSMWGTFLGLPPPPPPPPTYEDFCGRPCQLDLDIIIII